MSNNEQYHRTGVILQDNDEDFNVEVVRWRKKNGDHKKAVLKTVVETTIHERRRDGFANESVGTKMFRRLARSHPEWGLVVPRTYSENGMMSIRRFMKGEPLLSAGHEHDDTSRTIERVGRLAHLLTAIDRVEPDLSLPDDPRNSAPYDNMLVRTSAWALPALGSDLLASHDYTEAVEMIATNQQYLTPRYAHGDLMPYAHVLVRPDDRLAFIDFEHYSARKPRYYDAAYCYAQMYTKIDDPSIAATFMQTLVESADPVEHQSEQMMTVLSQRALRLFFDAWYDGRNSDDPIVRRTQRLLDMSLDGDMDQLLHPTR